MRNRAYSPQVGWVQRDPLGMADGPSLYAYVRLQPTTLTDPTGLGQLLLWILLVVLVIILLAIIWIKFLRRGYRCTPLSSAEDTQVNESIRKLVLCLRRERVEYPGDLGNMQIGGKLDPEDEHRLDANAITRRRCTCFGEGYFQKTQCGQYRTLLWESLRVAGNMVEVEHAGYENAQRQIDQVFSSIACCLECCHETNPPLSADPKGCC